MFTFDKAWAEKVYKERKTGTRNTGRTVSAVYHAMKYAIENQVDVVYLAGSESQRRWAFQIVEALLDQGVFPGAGASVGMSGYAFNGVGLGYGAGLSITNIIDEADRYGEGVVVADDLGEWADLHHRRPKYRNDIQALYHGLAPSIRDND